MKTTSLLITPWLLRALERVLRFVAQDCILLYRGPAIRPSIASASAGCGTTLRRMQFGDTAGYNPALRKILPCVLLLPALAFAAEHNLGELGKAGKLEVFNRTLDPTKAVAPDVVYLNAAAGDGLAWINGVEFSEGVLELEIKGKNVPGQSFVGLAFHGKDNQTFDAVYLRPFNFQVAERSNHSIQYISMPQHDWSDLRKNHPGKYEAAITPVPDPEAWVKLKLVIEGKRVSAYVNGSNKPALIVELLNDRLKGKVGLWVGNGSDGWYRKLKVTQTVEN